MKLEKMPKETRLKILKAVRSLLAERGRWVKGSYMTTYNMETNKTLAKPAFCLIGGINHIISTELSFHERAKYDLLRVTAGTSITDAGAAALSVLDAVKKRGYENVPDFNDKSRTRKRDVIALLDEKIAETEAE
jgi:hypothetical protein